MLLTWMTDLPSRFSAVSLSAEAFGGAPALAAQMKWSANDVWILLRDGPLLRVDGFGSSVRDADAARLGSNALHWLCGVRAEATRRGSSDGSIATVTVRQPGAYRLFAHALDGTGRVANASLPFRIADPTLVPGVAPSEGP